MSAVEKLCRTVRSFSLAEGENKTEFSFLSIFLFTERKIDMPEPDNFYIYVILDGSLRLHTPSGTMDFVPGQYSVSRIDIPKAGYVLTFSESRDFLALTVEFTLNDIISVLLDLDGDMAERIAKAQIEDRITAASDNHVISSISRLFGIMKEPIPLAFMGTQIKREIIFFILCGSHGSQFLQRSIFHQKFKSAVGMRPLQCQKRLRLTEARRLMLDENKNVTEASLEVGYESTSQFTRDYRKMFGLNPKEEILKLRNH